MSLKNIRERHKIVDGIINELKEPVAVARQAHQDRGELLKLMDEMQKVIDAQQKLLICYRIGKRPSEAILDTLDKASELGILK